LELPFLLLKQVRPLALALEVKETLTAALGS
jgi:hypothetical protein